MTKKKYNRPKHQKDVPLGDTSEEEINTVNIQGKSCPHVTRGIHFGRIKKSLKSTQNIVTCNGCSNENAEELPEVWLCLQCGYRGCGRMSENKHGLQHFRTLHSDCHSLVLSTTSGSVWCYDCDDEINLQSSRILKQSVEFVMKMMPKDSNKSNVQNANKVVHQQSLQNSVIKEETCVQNSVENTPPDKNKKLAKSDKENSQKISIKGLRNLGNTCFFNAVMQNLNQTPLLHHELNNTCTPSHLWQLPELTITNNEIAESDCNTVKLSLPRQFPLTNSLLNFLDQMSVASTSKIDIVNPTPLFGEISKKCPQFRHFQQQDSHELLRQLLDGVRQEEIKRQKKAILRYFDLENVCPENVDEELKKQIKAYGCYASHTIIEKVFGGLLISTVLCEECKASSQVFEPFMDLSLPLFEEKQQEHNEQLYGMLDGGKQDHLKPLRNKKAEWDSQDNAESDYVLTKPKTDPEKPSKHQEKKQKQLAKKERKKSRNSRNRKNSLNENCDNSTANQLSETKDDDEEEEEEEENNRDSEDPSNTGDQNEEIWEVPELFGEVEKKPRDEPESKSKAANSSTSELTEKFIELTVKSSKVKSETGVNDLSPCSQASEAVDVKHSLEVQNKCKPEECKINEAVKENLFVKSEVEVSVTAVTQKSIEDKGELMRKIIMTQNESTNSEKKVCDDAEREFENWIEEPNFRMCVGFTEKHLEQSEKIENTCNKIQIEESGDVAIKCSEKCPKDEEDISAKTIKKEIEEPVKITVKTTEENQNDLEEIVESDEKTEITNEPICNLTGDCLKIHSNQSNLDDRIQALSMQVKDARIRRDSDRQENLLNSSESAEDWESQKTNCTSPKSSIEDSCIENGDNWSHAISEQQTKDWISKTLTTLKPRHHVSPLECSINSCLSHFTKPELLTGNNKFRCENCTQLKVKKTGNRKDVVYSNASKQMLVFSPPAVLTLHLKRFQQVGMSLRKVNRFVEFPLVLDLAPYCCSACSILPHMSSVEDEILYSLYGIVEHSGRLTSGHYTAYVKSNKRTVNTVFECQLPLAQCDLEQLLQKFSGSKKDSSLDDCELTTEKCQWFYISDSHVKEVSEAQVLKCQAYLLFYERIK